MELQLFSVTQAAELLQVSESWLRKRVAAKAVPHLKLANRIRFTGDQLSRIQVAAEVPVEAGPHPVIVAMKGNQ